ncbi:hypothetical protein [Kribbella kalugense]|uniref:Histidine kinase n=1 Tax=Kribbella kalugense TaxID=2512221 RepID=A0A4V3G718_9ACTN|nr:hypothetical protein [Kribbella kalugense]TDW17074.1 hypothetical protein EV650_3635 [Kribbella kalugense]
MDAYREAQRLYAQAMLSTASGQDRIAELEQTVQRIGELVPTAAPGDRAAVLLMNSSLVELIAGESR